MYRPKRAGSGQAMSRRAMSSSGCAEMERKASVEHEHFGFGSLIMRVVERDLRLLYITNQAGPSPVVSARVESHAVLTLGELHFTETIDWPTAAIIARLPRSRASGTGSPAEGPRTRWKAFRSIAPRPSARPPC